MGLTSSDRSSTVEAPGRSPFAVLFDALSESIGSGTFESAARELIREELSDHPESANLGPFRSFAPLFARSVLAELPTRGLLHPGFEPQRVRLEAPSRTERHEEIEQIWTTLNERFFRSASAGALMTCRGEVAELDRRFRIESAASPGYFSLIEDLNRVLGAGAPFDVAPSESRLRALAHSPHGVLIACSHAASPWDIIMMHGLLAEILRRARIDGVPVPPEPRYVINRAVSEAFPEPLQTLYGALEAVSVDSSHVRSASGGRLNRRRMQRAVRGWIDGRHHLLIFPEGARNGLPLPFDARFQYGVGKLIVRALDERGETEVVPVGARWFDRRGRVHLGEAIRFRVRDGIVEVGRGSLHDLDLPGPSPFYDALATADPRAFLPVPLEGRMLRWAGDPESRRLVARVTAAIVARNVAVCLQAAGGT